MKYQRMTVWLLKDQVKFIKNQKVSASEFLRELLKIKR